MGAVSGKCSWQRGLAPFAAERPEGCFAQTVPVPCAAHGVAVRSPRSRRHVGEHDRGIESYVKLL